jgi:hypothetical protein
VSRWRVTYTMYGRSDWMVFSCRDDAKAFAAWGDDQGVFINAVVTKEVMGQ